MELAFKANELLAILRRVLELLEIVPRSRTGRTSVNWRTMSSVKVAIIEFIWRTKKKNIHIFLWIIELEGGQQSIHYGDAAQRKIVWIGIQEKMKFIFRYLL